MGIVDFIWRFFIPCRENNYHPQFLESGLLFFVAGVFLFLKLLNVSLVVSLPYTSFFGDVIESVLVERTNEERQRIGLPVLRESPKLEQAAYLKAQDMLQKGYFAHTSPQGVTPWYWFRKAGYAYQYAGENLAAGFLESEELFDAWYESPSHRNNLLNPNYREIGIAVVKGNFQGAETTLVVQMFGSPTQAQTISAVRQPKQKTTKEITEVGPLSSKEARPEKSALLGEVSEPEDVPAKPAPVTPTPAVKPSQSLQSEFIRFLATESSRVAQTLMAVFIFLFLAALTITMLAHFRFELQHRKILLQTVAIIIFLSALLAFDAEAVVRLIPHNIIL